MGATEIRSSLHELIDGIQNTDLLESLHEILMTRKNLANQSIWSELSDEQKKEVLDAYKESENLDNLIPHSQVLRELK